MEGKLIFCSDAILRFQSNYEETAAVPLFPFAERESFCSSVLIIDDSQNVGNILSIFICYEEKIMAGNRQHFIPRFLQRGFSNEKNVKYFTNWYRKDCFKENMIVENIGLENKFYSHYGDSSVDKK